ncbi:serine/threonine protein phosphatase [Bartonella sp. HY406]|uniref:serine/threonine protein phosphatase n=1 Tax=Bartonella sp. HY406 TaxID=2979331 RepID=UPI0021C60851|nr:serine/threonine protein phosphatase [Bartonella sp. HY406]UXN03208.1 serine/threonine protein phosphatase [Bartonella sp. HY406]
MLEFSFSDPYACSEADKVLIAASVGKRTSYAMRGDERVFIKRHDVGGPRLGRKLHGFLSPILPAHFLRASPILSPADMAKRELRKIALFQKHHIDVPEVICSDGSAIMMGDVGENIQTRLKQLRELNTHLHDSLLIQCSAALGDVHAAGLCHGRPHPVDMFLGQAKIGFFDFDEEPETVMSLAQAQARDAWLLFFQIATQAVDQERTPHAAFGAWRRKISLETLESLKELVLFFKFCILPLKLAKNIRLGVDGQNMLNAMEFFMLHLGLKAKS